MRILISGTTSLIGAAIAERFADGNELHLICRSAAQGGEIALRLEARGARSVRVIAADFASLPDDFEEQLEASYDLFINVVCATSRLRDSRIESEDAHRHAAVDLLSPLRIAKRLLETGRDRREAGGLRMIFVSTILTTVISPDRRIYSSFKVLQEAYLRKLVEKGPTPASLMVVRVARFIPPETGADKAAELAEAVYAANAEKRSELVHGVSGKALRLLFYVQPLVFMLVMAVQRRLRRVVA